MKSKLIFLVSLALSFPLIAQADQIEQSVECASGTTVLEYGQNATCQIDAESDQDRFQFTATAGDVFYVTLTKLGGGYRPKAEIYTPSNIKVTGLETDSSQSGYDSERYTATESGTYSINVSDKVAGIQCVSGTCPEGGEAQPSLDYLAGVEYCRTNPIECGVAMPSVGADLSISLPLATFGDSPVEKLWAELRYKGDLTWELDDFSFVE